MRCEVNGCVNNEDGYCTASSYVEIDRNGECSLLQIPTIDLGLKYKKKED